MSTIAELNHYTGFPAVVFDDIPLPDRESFQVDTEEKAAWAASKFLAAANRIEERFRLADHYKAKIDDWLARANKEDEDSVDFMRMVLRPWVTAAVAAKSRSKTLKVLGARLSLRKNPDKVEITDQELALSFCEANLPEAVVVKRDVSKATLRQAIDGGLVVPGVELLPGAEELVIKED
jgi:phage host-nuclease inhibitor protein Gam